MEDEVVMTGLEIIIRDIYDVLNKSIDFHERYYDIYPGDLEDLIECRLLCERLLYFDYFKKSEAYLDEHNQSECSYKKFKKVLDEWEVLYKKDLKEKRKDLERLFDLIVNTSEEI